IIIHMIVMRCLYHTYTKQYEINNTQINAKLFYRILENILNTDMSLKNARFLYLYDEKINNYIDLLKIADINNVSFDANSLNKNFKFLLNDYNNYNPEINITSDEYSAQQNNEYYNLNTQVSG